MGLFKRSRDEYAGTEVIIDHMKMANYLMFLSQELNVNDFTAPSVTTTSTSHRYSGNRVYECKTCSRQFTSFQALGGHRASHKRPKLISNSLSNGQGSQGVLISSSPTKPKTHECSICGLEFGIGQALGGHMRRHRVANNTTNSVESIRLKNEMMKSITTSTSSKVNILCLDLNLTPLENDI